MKLSIIIFTTPFISMGTALGINCRGSSNCAGNIGDLADLYVKVQGINSGNSYPAGQHIACVNNICAFYQSNNGGTAGDALFHIKNLLNHGCKKCGSDPTTPGNNDVSKGQLTCNWVISP